MAEKIDFAGRRRARALVVQGLYQFILTRGDSEAIRLYLSENPAWKHCDVDYFDILWAGVMRDFRTLNDAFSPYLSRDSDAISPVEQAVLMLATWELINRLEIPYKIILNEAIDLTKTYGGSDGHKFVNGVLDKLANVLRKSEGR